MRRSAARLLPSCVLVALATACGGGGPAVVITVEPARAALAPGASLRFVAHVENASGDERVTWSVEPASAGTIDPRGWFTAAAGVPDGSSVTATAVWERDPSVRGSATIVFRSQLVDHGGPLLPASRTYALWWGDPALFPPGARAAVESFLGQLPGTAYLATTNEYLRGQHATTVFAGSWSRQDTPPDPVAGPLDAPICAALDAFGLQPDPAGVYLLLSAGFPAFAGGKVEYCAFHSYADCHGTRVAFAYAPNPTGTVCHHSQPPPDCTSLSPDANETVDLVAHELLEAITSPQLSGWFDANGAENADKCLMDFACVPLGASKFWVQKMYSNAQQACVAQ